MAILDSLYNYEPAQVKVPIAEDIPELAGHYLLVDSLAHDGFIDRLLPARRAIAERGEVSEEDDTIMLAFCEVSEWSLDEELTLDNFAKLIKSPVMLPRRKRLIMAIDNAASQKGAHFRKKSQPLSTGSGENGISTDQPEQKASKPDEKA